ncbi:CBS domain-containing protein [Streptomyces sp. S1A]|uniref:CBS domain-containing protein n=1 Tax=Streptomyces chitinivorans TaxID=1257027 RepID=A0ABW7HP07_9ACTN|nr:MULTISPECIES: CBS domain-containing protein [Streptomyces]MCG3039851.1 CBS domain-containing protein [Streptomyces sp. ICN903]MDH2408334.1 CBS domain-containing protein [Streptomyces chitinivorans]
MTPARTRHRAVDSPPRTTTADRNASGPRVWDDMTVEVALSLMACARVDHLVLCDGDDRNTGLVTLARLAVLRDSPAYTDRIRLRDVLAGPFASTADAPRPAGPSSFAP